MKLTDEEFTGLLAIHAVAEYGQDTDPTPNWDELTSLLHAELEARGYPDAYVAYQTLVMGAR